MGQVFKILSESESDTILIGETLGKLLKPPITIALSGPLGSGKTVFVRGVAKGLGIIRVRSPSFLIMLKYKGDKYPLFHLDLYRIDNWEELITLGILEILETGIVAVEWAEKAKEILPNRRIEITLKFVNDKRMISIKAVGDSEPTIQKLVANLPNRLKGKVPD